MNNWFISDKLTFDVYEYGGMQLLHEYEYDHNIDKWEDTGKGKIVLLNRRSDGDIYHSEMSMVFPTYEEAGKVKKEFDDFIRGKQQERNLACSSFSQSRGMAKA